MGKDYPLRFSFKGCKEKCKGDGMTGDCFDYGRCKCKDGYYMSGDGCKSMSIDSSIIHQEFFAENQYFDLNLVVIRRGHPKFLFLLKNVIALNQE